MNSSSTDKVHDVNETLELTEELESGRLSPSDYVRERAVIVGEGNVIDSLIRPIVGTVLEMLTPANRAHNTK